MSGTVGGGIGQLVSRWLVIAVFGVLGAAVGEIAGAEPTTCIDVSDCQMGETCEDTPGGDQVDAHGICVKRCSWPELHVEAAGALDREVDGQQYRLYYLSIINWRLLPEYMFEKAPDLPPCGQNPNAARSWVTIYSVGENTELKTFCGLDTREELERGVLGEDRGIWFATPLGATPATEVLVKINDRRNGGLYCSNRVLILGD